MKLTQSEKQAAETRRGRLKGGAIDWDYWAPRINGYPADLAARTIGCGETAVREAHQRGDIFISFKRPRKTK